MVTVLVPTETAKYCFLYEAVDFVSFGQLPLNDHPIGGREDREDFAYQENVSGYMEGLDYQPIQTAISDETYKAVGVGLSPMWEEVGKWIGESARPEIDREGLAKRQAEWGERLTTLLDSSWMRLFTLLHLMHPQKSGPT
jgi:hypothetical protein